MKHSSRKSIIKNRRQTPENKLFASLVLSIINIFTICVCFAAVTYAWFVDVSTTSGSDLESGLLAVEIMNVGSGEDGNPDPEALYDITEDAPVFNFDAFGEFNLGSNIFSYVAVVNQGSLDAEYNVGFTTEFDSELADLGEIIDVFYAFASADSMPDPSNLTASAFEFIYLGKLSDVSRNTGIFLEGPGDEENPNPQYYDEYENQTIRIKGVLDAALPAPLEDEDPRHLVDYFCLRLMLPDAAQAKYQGQSLKLNVELHAINTLEDNLADLITATNDESMGLVLGGGTYYKSHTVILDPVPADGFKFDHWEDRSGTRLELTKYIDPDMSEAELKEDDRYIVVLEEDSYYKAVFKKASEYEEWTGDDPFADDEEPEEPDDPENPDDGDEDVEIIL